MAWIKVLLIFSFLVVIVMLFRHRQRVELRAGTRLVGLLLCLLAVASVADPDIPQVGAEWLGVNRGTDLILYVLVVVFVMTTLGLYFRLREADRRLLKLARAMAITQAVDRDGPPGGESLS